MTRKMKAISLLIKAILLFNNKNWEELAKTVGI